MVDARNRAGFTPLELAVSNEHIDCCNLLREAHTSFAQKAADENSGNGTGNTTSVATSRRVSDMTSAFGDLQQSGELMIIQLKPNRRINYIGAIE